MNPDEIRAIVREELRMFIGTSTYQFGRDVEVFNGRNFRFGTSVGTQLGTSSTQKLALWGVTPSVQPSAIANVTEVGTDTDGTARAKINLILEALRDSGNIAS